MEGDQVGRINQLTTGDFLVVGGQAALDLAAAPFKKLTQLEQENHDLRKMLDQMMGTPAARFLSLMKKLEEIFPDDHLFDGTPYEMRLYPKLEEMKKLADSVPGLQYKIDRLMLEYCPEDTTEEQLDKWAAHQCVVNL